MRATLIGFGAFLFLAYPLVILFSVASKLDQSQQKPATASIILTPRSANQWLERDSEQRSRTVLRNATIRRSDH
ncbi:MAG: hypothetical protein O3C40_18345 [Planctomycetota bacterium]|nr:hypothetical protein [Planctomycetota bacterium]